MPKARINQIFKRSSQQIYNVTIFFLFFMSLYGLLGVQVNTASHFCIALKAVSSLRDQTGLAIFFLK
jgi:hypothetical protein